MQFLTDYAKLWTGCIYSITYISHINYLLHFLQEHSTALDLLKALRDAKMTLEVLQVRLFHIWLISGSYNLSQLKLPSSFSFEFLMTLLQTSEIQRFKKSSQTIVRALKRDCQYSISVSINEMNKWLLLPFCTQDATTLSHIYWIHFWPFIGIFRVFVLI